MVANMRECARKVMRYTIVMIVLFGITNQAQALSYKGSCFSGGHSCLKGASYIYSILTKVCGLQTDVDIIEEKVCAIESKLDNLDVICSGIDLPEFDFIESKLCLIEQQVESLIDGQDNLTSKVCDIQLIIDDIDMVVNIIEDKVCDTQTKVDTILDNQTTLIDGQQEILSKVCVVDSKVDNIVVDIDSTTIDNIESKVCAIDSKLDNLEVDCNLQPVESKLCIIESLVSEPDGCVTKVFNQSDIPFSITEPGFYILEENVTYTGSMTAIVIASNDVVLDLCNRRVTVTDSTALGIDVGLNLSNVTIMNGTLDGGKDGISYYTNTVGLNKLVVDSINFCNIREKAIATVLLSGATISIVDCQIRNCTFLECGKFNTTGGIVDLIGAQETVVTGCFFSDNGSPVSPTTLINIEDSANCSVLNSQCARNVGGIFNGILMNNTSKCLLQNLRLDCNIGAEVTILNLMNTTKSTFLDITMNGNTATDIFVGVSASASYPSNANRFERIFINGNQSNSIAASAGFLFDGSDNNSFTNCQVTNNTSQTQGFHGFVSCNADGNMYLECIGSNNLGYGDGDGFLFTDCTRHYCIRCLAFSNSDAGFQVAGTTTNSGFRDCQAMYNGRVGFDLAGANTTVTLFRNIACGNGSQ